MQIKTSVRHHLAPVRMAILRKMTNSEHWWGCKEKGTLVCRQWECKLVQRYEYGVCFKNRTIWFSSPIPRYLVKDNDNTNSKRYMCPNVHSNTICNCQDIEAAKVSINRWIYREDVGGVVCVCVEGGILLSHKKWKTFQPHGWTRRMLWSKSDQKRHTMLSMAILSWTRPISSDLGS